MLPKLENFRKARVGIPKQGLVCIMTAFNNNEKKRRKPTASLKQVSKQVNRREANIFL